MMTRESFISTIKNLEQLDPSEQSELLKEYENRINNNSALIDLQASIDAHRQGLGEVWKTGFPKLDEKLDGGFIGEQLICLGAISSLGKTSFALQIATQIAEQEKDVLIFSLEMSQNELNAKTISRYSHIQTANLVKILGNGQALTTRDVLSGRIGGVIMGEDPQATDEKGKVFVNAFNAAKKISDHIHVFVGESDISVDDVRYIAFAHKKLTGKSPFVILDYLQILQPSMEAQTTDKRLLTDYDVTRLKVLSRDLHIPVMVISAFNRTSYLEPVSMGSFRESSGIEYSSDILFAMQYQGMDYKKHWFTTQSGAKKKVFESSQDHNNRVRDLLNKMDEDGANGLPLPIELKILKNRNGTKGTVNYDFLPAYNYYHEGVTRPYVDPDDDLEEGTDEESSSVVSSKKASKGRKASSKRPAEDDIIGEV